MTDYDSADFFRDKAVMVDPYPYFDHLRAKSAVWREPHHGVFLVTGWEEAKEVYQDAETFSSCNATTGPFPGFPVPLEGDDVSELIEKHRDELPFSDQLPTFDPPKHTQHRGLLKGLMTPKRMRENEEFMWRLADRVIDEFHARGSCEVIREYARVFTLLVVADLLGVPEEDHDAFRKGTDRRPSGLMGSDKEMTHKPLEFLYDQFTEYIEDRRRSPRKDVLTGLASATFPDGSLPEAIDVVRIATNLFAAGQETTVRLIAFALLLIGERPELQKLLREERDRIPQFIQEALRLESPVTGDFRLARVPATIGGVHIPAGSTLMVANGAANRDPRKFPDPTEFDIDRANASLNMAFGYGIHTCVGAALAQTEARVSFERILDRMADIKISEAEHGPPDARRYEYEPTYMLRGLRRLHLKFTPVA